MIFGNLFQTKIIILIFIGIFWQPCFEKFPGYDHSNKIKLHIIIPIKFKAQTFHFIKYKLISIRKVNIQ